VFVCPSANSSVENFGGGTNTAQNRCNWSEPNGHYTDTVSYSYADPFPDATANGSGYKLVAGIDPGLAIAADVNCGITGSTQANGVSDNVLLVSTTSSALQMQWANSNNHAKQGQNILFADGHVEFDNTALVGIARDNIYTSQESTSTLAGSPLNASDSYLMPTDDN